VSTVSVPILDLTPPLQVPARPLRSGGHRDPLRICQVVGYDLSETGGVKHHAVQLARALRAGGDQVTVIGPSSRPLGDPDQYGFPGVVKVGSRSSGSNSAIGMFIDPWRVRAFFRRNQFDVVHVHEPLLPPLAYYTLWSSRSAAHVGTFHSFTEAPSRRLLTFGRLASAVQAPRFQVSTAVSEAAARHARTSWSWPNPIDLVPNGVPVEIFVPPNSPREPGPTRLLFVGRLSDPRKGLAQLREAFIRLRARGFRVTLDVVGDPGGGQAPLPTPGLNYLGSLPLATLIECYQRCDIFIAPSTGMESFGIVLLEAMAAGRPVVCSDIEGYRSTVTTDGAWLSPPGDVQALESRLAALVVRPDLWPVMGEANRRRAQQFAWERVAADTRSAYLEAVVRRAHRQLGRPPRRLMSDAPMALEAESGGGVSTGQRSSVLIANRDDSSALSEASSSTSVSTSPRGDSWSARALRIAMAAGVAIGAVLLARRLDLSALKTALAQSSLHLLVVASVLSSLSQWAKAFLWRVMLDAPASVTTGRLFRYGAATASLSMVAPIRAGEALRPWLLWRNHAVPLSNSAGVALSERIMDLLALAAVVLPLLWFVPPLPHWVGRAISLLAVGSVAIFATGTLAARRPSGTGRLGRLLRGIRVLTETGTLARAFGAALLVWMFDLAALWVSLRAVGIHQGYAGVAFVLLGVNTAMLLPAPPGNFGTLEAGAVLAMGVLGVSRPAATAGALLYHAAQIVPLLTFAVLDSPTTLALLRTRCSPRAIANRAR
jgi:phosphatidyl-myo-inositol alpha-mannosyltransferase